MKHYAYILLAVMLAFTGCRTTQQLARIEQQQTVMTHRLDSMSQRIDSMQQQLTQMTARLSELTGTPQPTTTTTPTTQQRRDWTTCVMRGAKAKVTVGGKTYKSPCATQAVWDSLVIISIMPAFGIEVFRIEATPRDVTVINKKDKEYYRATYAEINAFVRPFVTYADLRSLAGGKNPSVARNGVLTYSAQGSSASLEMSFTTPVLNQPLTIQRTNLKTYTRKDIHTLIR